MNGAMYPPNDSFLFLAMFLPNPAAKHIMDRTRFRGQKTLSIFENLLGSNALYLTEINWSFLRNVMHRIVLFIVTAVTSNLT
jgi:hypothetical protein